jgi:acetyltransferase-like isoleucine patch superfamily enzyme
MKNLHKIPENISYIKLHQSHGKGTFQREEFERIGSNVIIEEGVRVFHPEHIEIGNNVYIGHDTILKGYYKNKMTIGSHTWIGQRCFLHSAGGIHIGEAVGIGPGVCILTSVHTEELGKPILYNDLKLSEVIIEDGCDIGINAIILPGITIGEGSIIGAGSIVTKDVKSYRIVAGNPAKLLRERNKSQPSSGNNK